MVNLLLRVDNAIGKIEMRLAQIPIEEQVSDNPEPKKLRQMRDYFKQVKKVLENVEAAFKVVGV